MAMMLFSLCILIAGAFFAVVFNRTKAGQVGPVAAFAGSLLAAAVGAQGLFSDTIWGFKAPWPVPLGSLNLGMDPLSALFVVLIGSISALAAIYGVGYLEKEGDKAKAAASWCWYNLLVAAMLVVVLARDGFLFLVAWEIMTLASFFLVMFDHHREGVIRAGWTYLAAAHIGTAFLLAMFLLLSHEGGMDFAGLSASGGMGSVVFAMALIGFGVKAGFVPLHVWLPEAHPAAPSHVSALMSGVMIKTGIYGILRVMLILGAPAAWWGWTLVIIGGVSGVLGVLFALAQHDLKRLLAYHSVENIGIIALGLGIGTLGITSGNPAMAVLGMCGGLMHVLNHGIFKSLLFMGAGSVLHATGSRQIDEMGGLIKKMPVTGASFLIGAAAISGLPPLNGFISEFLIYIAAFSGISASAQVWGGLLVVAALALIGGLAAACFTKAFGIVFLGEPRAKASEHAHEAPAAMGWPMGVLAFLCVAIGLTAPLTIRLVLPAAIQLVPESINSAVIETASGLLIRISFAALLLIVLAAAIFFLRTRLLSRRSVRQEVTWDCGYAFPTSRMQYTASSFASPIVKMFDMVLQTRKNIQLPQGLFPEKADLHTHTDDIFIKRICAPAVSFISRLADGFHRLQPGRTHLYISYIVITILVLLIWNLG